ncbi:MAG TPA: C25 family cysteine peptidase, partial [Bacteroidales bacterium]|nr:C25 family cysteine peptidase [Bacteroidales bacterium]
MSRYQYKILNVLVVFFLLATIPTLYGQGILRNHARPEITILQSDARQLILEVRFPVPQIVNPLHTEPGYFSLTMPECYPSDVPGLPNLPVWNRMIEIPVEASWQISVTEMSTRDVEIPGSFMGMELSPVQLPISKSTLDDRPFIKNAEVYTRNEWFDYGGARILDDGIMRNARIARLSISPVQYHPVTRQVRYMEYAKVHITFSGGISNPVAFKQNFASPVADPSSVTLNGNAFQIYSPITGPVHYIILSDSMFLNTLQPFIAWKKKKGFKVTEVYRGSPGVGSTTTSMKAYLKGIWDASSPANPAPSYLLIVGDVAQIPAFNGSAGNHVTDLYYAEYTGDIYPELEYGRFSATSVAQLQPQIDKTLMVDQFSMPSAGYLENGLLVAGNDANNASIYANGQMHYAENEYVKPLNGMQAYAFLYPASSGQISQIVQRFNEGVSLVNYSAHGSSSGWSDPAFTSTTVQSLTNTGRYPTVISNACETGKFGLSQCFGETLLRAENKGAAGHIGASDLTYWDEDYYFAVGLGPIVVNPTYNQSGLGFWDRLFHTHGEPYSQWWTTQGGIVQAGNLSVTQSGLSVPYYWEIYHLMGDPSLMPWLGVPANPTVTFLSTLPTGLSQVSIQADPYQYVALSYNGQIHGAGVTNGNGFVNLQIQPFSQPANALLSITGQNRIPYFDTIHLVTPTGPFILADSVSYIDLGGNSNQQTDAGEPILLNVRVKNFTSFPSGNLTLKLLISDSYITLTDSLHTLSGITGAASVNIASAFSFQIKDFVPDQHTVTGVIRIEDGSQFWNTPVGFTINSAV